MSRVTRDKATFTRQLKASVYVGFCIGLVFAVVGGILAMLQGAERLKTNGLSVGRLIAIYLGGGVVAGVIVGLLLPFAKRSLLAAMVVGYTAISPITLAIAFLITRESSASPFAIAPLASLTGALAAWYIWRMEHSP